MTNFPKDPYLPAKVSNRQMTYTNETGSELIKITEQDGKRAVNARDLHAFLESKQEFATWIKFRIQQYDFVENEDYVRLTNLSSEGRGGQNKVEYALTLNMAKELSMVEGNAKGKEARRYFIACEEAATGYAFPAGIQDRLKALETKIDTVLSIQEKHPPVITLKKELITMQEAALYTGLSLGTMYKLTHRKRIPYYKSKFGKRIYIKLPELIKWMSSIRIKTDDELESDVASYCVTKKFKNHGN